MCLLRYNWNECFNLNLENSKVFVLKCNASSALSTMSYPGYPPSGGYPPQPPGPGYPSGGGLGFGPPAGYPPTPQQVSWQCKVT